MSRPARFYRLLLKLYPARFREEYARPLERAFLDEYRETRTRGQRLVFWLRTLGDLARSVPAQVALELGHDARYALRVYARRPVVSLLAVSALALSIGATTGVFSVVNAILLRSLPFNEPERLVQLMPPHGGFGPSPAFHRWRHESRYLADAVNYDRADMNLTAAAGSARVSVTESSFNFFSMLGAEPTIGRGFVEGEDAKGADLVAVIGYGLFQQLFGGDLRALGQSITLNGQPVTVVGVARPGFDYPGRTTVWVPTAFDVARLPKTGITFVETIARLKPGIAWAQANAMFEADHAEEISAPAPRGDERPRPRLIPLREQLAGPVRQASLVLMGAVAFVLLIACANVANLLLTRITERRTELAIRATLGASRARLVQQLVTESVALSIVAAVAGLVVAAWAARLAAAVQPPGLALQEYAVLDARVLGFAVGVGVLTALVFGVTPALMAAGRLRPVETLVRAAGTHSLPTGRLRRLLMAAQVALTVVLLAGALVMGRSFLALAGADLGFRTSGVITMNVSLAGSRYATEKRTDQYFREALTRLRGLGGVDAAGGIDFLPLASLAYGGGRFDVEDGTPVNMALVVTATADYFRTMGTPFLAGRDFNDADTRESEGVAIVNEAFARESGLDRAVVGRQITMKMSTTPDRVVGLVRGARNRGPMGEETPQVYYSQGQASPNFMTLVAHVDNAQAMLPIARQAVQAVDPRVPVFAARTLDEHLRTVLARPRFYTAAILFLGGFAVLLSIVGIYGVSSYAVVQRRHEIGVRLAIGASAPAVRSMLMRQSLLPVGLGVLAGVPAAFGAARFLWHLLSTVQPLDAATCAAAAFTLAVVSGATVWLAIGKVMRSNPLDALKAE